MRHTCSLFETGFWLFTQFRDIPSKLYRVVFAVDQLKVANADWKTNPAPFLEKKLPSPNGVIYALMAKANRWFEEHSPYVQTSSGGLQHYSGRKVRRDAVQGLEKVRSMEFEASPSAPASNSCCNQSCLVRCGVLFFKWLYFEFKLLASLGKLFLPFKVMVDLWFKSIVYDLYANQNADPSSDIVYALERGVYFLLFEAIFAHVNYLLRYFVMKDRRYVLHHTSAKFEELLEIAVGIILFFQGLFYGGGVLPKFLAIILLIAAPSVALLAYFVRAVQRFHASSAPKKLLNITGLGWLNSLLTFFLYLLPPFSLFSVTLHAIPLFTGNNYSTKQLVKYGIAPLLVSLFRLCVEVFLNQVEVGWYSYFSSFRFACYISALIGGLFNLVELVPAFSALLLVFGWTCSKDQYGDPTVNFTASSCVYLWFLIIPSVVSAIIDILLHYDEAILGAARRALKQPRRETLAKLPRLRALYPSEPLSDLLISANHAVSNDVMRKANNALGVSSDLSTWYLLGGVKCEELEALSGAGGVTWFSDMTSTESLQEALHLFSVNLLDYLAATKNPAMIAYVLLMEEDVFAAYKGDLLFRSYMNLFLDRLRMLRHRATTLEEIEQVYEYLNRIFHGTFGVDAQASLYLSVARTHFALILHEMKLDRAARENLDFGGALTEYASRYRGWNNPFTSRVALVSAQRLMHGNQFDDERKQCSEAVITFNIRGTLNYRRESCPYRPGSKAVNQFLLALKDLLCQFIFLSLPKGEAVWHALLTTHDSAIASAFCVYFMVSSVRPSAGEAQNDVLQNMVDVLYACYLGCDDLNLQSFLSVFFHRHSVYQYERARPSISKLMKQPMSYLMYADKFKQTFLRQMFPDFEAHIVRYLLHACVDKGGCCRSHEVLESAEPMQNLIKFLMQTPQNTDAVAAELNKEGSPAIFRSIIFDGNQGKFCIHNRDIKLLETVWIKTLIEFINLVFNVRHQFPLLLDDVGALRHLAVHPEASIAEATGIDVGALALDSRGPGASAYDALPPNQTMRPGEVLARQNFVGFATGRVLDSKQDGDVESRSRGRSGSGSSGGTEYSDVVLELRFGDEPPVSSNVIVVAEPPGGLPDDASPREIRDRHDEVLSQYQGFFDRAGIGGGVREETRRPTGFVAFVPETEEEIVDVTMRALQRLRGEVNQPRAGMS